MTSYSLNMAANFSLNFDRVYGTLQGLIRANHVNGQRIKLYIYCRFFFA